MPGYREHRVDRELGLWVECVWRRSGADRTDGYDRIVPDGCMDLIWSERSGVTVVGPNTTAFVSSPAPGATVVGVRLHPGAGAPLFGIRAPELRDAHVAARELWGDAGALLDQQAARAADAATVLIEFLSGRAKREAGPDPLVRAAAVRLARTRVGEIARELAVSERQLRRRVEEHVGYGPKRLGRVLRLQRALRWLRGGAELAETAFECGYSDQAHFGNEFRELAGVAPGRFLQDARIPACDQAVHDRHTETGMGDRVGAGRAGGARVL
jgi:AraC-like DNA-binding protein